MGSRGFKRRRALLQLPRANHARMDVAAVLAAAEAWFAAEPARIAALKPKREDYDDYAAFRRAYKSWHVTWTRSKKQDPRDDPAKRLIVLSLLIGT